MLIEINNLVKSFGDLKVINNLDLVVDQGEVLADTTPDKIFDFPEHARIKGFFNKML